MQATAVITGLLGFVVLYGGLACCIGIAWYHSQRLQRGESQE